MAEFENGDPLESIESEVQSYREFSDSAAVDYIAERASELKPSLTDEEFRAIYTYQGPVHKVVNAHYRGSGVREDPDSKVEDLSKELDSVFARSKLKENVRLYRGAFLDADQIAKFKPGSVVTDPAYMSTSLSRATTEHFGDTILHIDAPVGTPAIPAKTGRETDVEAEYILPRNTKLMVLSNEQVGEDTVIRARVIQDE